MDSLTKGYTAMQPKPHLPEETIAKLCDRLENATLLEDRRAAVLALKSFSREFRETVASSGLRGILKALTQDGADEDTLRALIEMLAILLDPGDGPLDTDITGLWMADEISLNQTLVTALVNALSYKDFYMSLYTIKLLSSLVKRRPSQMQQAIMACPLAISYLVETLDSSMEPIRNSGILLLIELCRNNIETQKIIAFENTMEKVLRIIELEGPLAGAVVTKDCYVLLLALVNNNSANQSIFKESGCMKTLARLLESNATEAVSINMWDASRLQNYTLSIDVVIAFAGNAGLHLPRNQLALMQSGVTGALIAAAFDNKGFIPQSVRSHAFTAIAMSIDDNEKCQNYYTAYRLSTTNEFFDDRLRIPACVQASIYLLVDPETPGTVRSCALDTFAALVNGNKALRETLIDELVRLFYQQKLETEDSWYDVIGFIVEIDETSASASVWASCMILVQILEGEPEFKLKLKNTLVDDSTDIENETEERVDGDGIDTDTVTMAMTIAANAVTCLNNNFDSRICSAYLMLMGIWCYDCPPVIADMLADSAIVNSLLAFLFQVNTPNIEERMQVQGLCALVLLVLYGFDTEDSTPQTRDMLLKQITERQGSDLIIGRFDILRNSPEVRSYPFVQEGSGSMSTIEGDLLNSSALVSGSAISVSAMSKTFVDFLKDNYARLRDALNQGPGLTRITKPRGPTREQLEIQSLRDELAMRNEEIEVRKNEVSALQVQAQRMVELSSASLTKDIEQLNSQLSLARSQIAASEEKVKSSSEQIAEQQKDIKALKKQLSAQATELEDKAADIDSRKRELQNWTKSFESERKKRMDAEASVKNLTSQLGQQQKAVSALQNDRENLQSQLRVAQSTSDKKSNEAKKSLDTIATLQKEIKTLQEEQGSKIEALEAQLKDAGSKLEASLENIKQLQDAKERIEADLSKEQAAHNESREVHQKLKHELETKARLALDDYKSLEQKHNALSKDYDNISQSAPNSNSSLKDEMDRLSHDFSELQTSHAQTELDKTQLSKEMEFIKASAADAESKLTEQCKDLRDQMAVAQEEKSRLSKELKELQKANLSLERRIKDTAKDSRNGLEYESRIKKLETELEESTKRAKESEEDWMLVIEELENKRKRDRQRLVELGETVSDEEEDEEEDDEDEGDEEHSDHGNGNINE